MFKLSDVTQYLDAQVNLTTVLLAVGALWLIWIIGKKMVLSAFGVLKLLKLGMPLAALMFMTGLSGFGYGVGELRTGYKEAEQQSSFTNQELMTFAHDKDAKPEVVSAVFKQANDQLVNRPTVPQILSRTEIAKTEPPGSTRIGWVALIGGIGMALSGVVTFIKKVSNCNC